VGTEESAALLDGNPLDGVPANRTFLVLTVGNLKFKMSRSFIPRRPEIGICAGAFAAYSFL
jgi:hypothetical protein